MSKVVKVSVLGKPPANRREPEDAPLLAAIGSLMLQYAHLEHELHAAFCLLTGVSNEAAKIVFPDLTTGAILNYLEKLIDVSPMPEWLQNQLEYIVEQSRRIATLRNNLGHRRNLFDSATGTVVRSYHPKSGQSIEQGVDYTMAAIELAESDLYAMQQQLDLIVAHLEFFATNPKVFEAMQDMAFLYTWQYIPTGLPPVSLDKIRSIRSKKRRDQKP